MRVNGKRITLLLLSGMLVLATVGPTFTNRATAAQITDRSLTLQAGATDGGSKPGGVVKHRFDFTLPTADSIGSIRFEYCTTASGTCTTPIGLATTAATLDEQNGATGFTINNTLDGKPYITRTAALTTANLPVYYTLGSVTNPTATNQAFYVRISTFTSGDTSGTAIDTGSVVTSTATEIELTGIMPESLIFCTGGTVGTTSGIPDCSTATGGSVSFNQLFSPSDTAIASSQMAASTNAGFGYTISVNGTTLTSGSNTIPAINTTPSGSIKGVSQFGMNLRANTSGAAASFPGTSADITPASNGTSLRGQARTDYGTADSFKFSSGEVIAASDNLTPGPTNAQIYTKSYIVNVSGNQPAGTYVTTLTYIATATF